MEIIPKLFSQLKELYQYFYKQLYPTYKASLNVVIREITLGQIKDT